MSNSLVFQTGDVVAYSRHFLRNCGIWHQQFADRRGTVAIVHEPRRGVPDVLTVRWHDGDVQRVLPTNLVLANRLHLEPR